MDGPIRSVSFRRRICTLQPIRSSPLTGIRLQKRCRNSQTYFRHVVDAERWRELVSVREGDLVGGSFQGDFRPQEETVPQGVPV